eukprot:s17_g5.t1
MVVMMMMLLTVAAVVVLKVIDGYANPMLPTLPRSRHRHRRRRSACRYTSSQCHYLCLRCQLRRYIRKQLPWVLQARHRNTRLWISLQLLTVALCCHPWRRLRRPALRVISCSGSPRKLPLSLLLRTRRVRRHALCTTSARTALSTALAHIRTQRFKRHHEIFNWRSTRRRFGVGASPRATACPLRGRSSSSTRANMWDTAVLGQFKSVGAGASRQPGRIFRMLHTHWQGLARHAESCLSMAFSVRRRFGPPYDDSMIRFWSVGID